MAKFVSAPYWQISTDRWLVRAGPEHEALVPAGDKKPLLQAAERAYQKLAGAKQFWDKKDAVVTG